MEDVVGLLAERRRLGLLHLLARVMDNSFSNFAVALLEIMIEDNLDKI